MNGIVFFIHSFLDFKKSFVLNIRNNDLKITNQMSKQIFSLPMYPELSYKKLERVISVLNRF